MDNYNFFGSGVGGTVTPRAGPGKIRWLGTTNTAQNNTPAAPTTLETSDPLKLTMVALILLYASGSLGYTAGKKSTSQLSKQASKAFRPKDVSNITG